MKKLAFLMLGLVLVFTSCDVDDDGPKSITYFAKVTEVDLPEYFEKGETYDIDVTYLLPTACHQKAGIYVQRGGETAEKYREIYIVGVANADADLVECNLEDDDLEELDDFDFLVDRDEPYTFFLWQGLDDDDKDIYTEIVVPVGAPDEDGGDDNTDDETGEETEE